MASLWQKMPPFLISHDFRANRKVGREISQDGERGPFPFLTWNWSERPFGQCKTKGNRSLPPKSLNSFAQKTVICFHLKQLQDIAPGAVGGFCYGLCEMLYSLADVGRSDYCPLILRVDTVSRARDLHIQSCVQMWSFSDEGTRKSPEPGRGHGKANH